MFRTFNFGEFLRYRVKNKILPILWLVSLPFLWVFTHWLAFGANQHVLSSLKDVIFEDFIGSRAHPRYTILVLLCVLASAIYWIRHPNIKSFLLTIFCTWGLMNYYILYAMSILYNNTY